MMDEKTHYIQQYPDRETKYPFTLIDEYCRFCGKQGVWEDDCDDYYVGTGIWCAKCGSKYQNPGYYEADERTLELLRKIEELRK